MDKDPLSYTLAQYMVVIVISAWGGVVSWFIESSTSPRISLFDLIGKITTAIFSGIVAFYVMESFGSPPLITISIVAISAYSGVKLIRHAETILHRILKQKLEGELPP